MSFWCFLYIHAIAGASSYVFSRLIIYILGNINENLRAALIYIPITEIITFLLVVITSHLIFRNKHIRKGMLAYGLISIVENYSSAYTNIARYEYIPGAETYIWYLFAWTVVLSTSLIILSRITPNNDNKGIKHIYRIKQNKIDTSNDVKPESDAMNLHENITSKQCNSNNKEQKYKHHDGASKKLIICVAAIAATIIIILLSTIPSNITIYYDGNTEEGTIIDKNNPGIHVVADYLIGGSRVVNSGYDVGSTTLVAGKDSTVAVSFKGRVKNFNIRCTTSPITTLMAEYKGSTDDGVTIDSGNPDITVTYERENGEKGILNDWTVESPVTLKADQISTVKIDYQNASCSLKIECSTVNLNNYKYVKNLNSLDPGDLALLKCVYIDTSKDGQYVVYSVGDDSHLKSYHNDENIALIQDNSGKAYDSWEYLYVYGRYDGEQIISRRIIDQGQYEKAFDPTGWFVLTTSGNVLPTPFFDYIDSDAPIYEGPLSPDIPDSVTYYLSENALNYYLNILKECGLYPKYDSKDDNFEYYYVYDSDNNLIGGILYSITDNGYLSKGVMLLN